MKLAATRVFFRETDRKRLVSRLTAVTGEDLAEPEIRKLADGDLSLIQQLDAPAQQGVMALVKGESLDDQARGELEKIVGRTIDYVSIAFLERSAASAWACFLVPKQERRVLRQLLWHLGSRS